MAITDVKLKGVKPRRKQFKIADGKGLFVLVTPSGGKYWRYRFKFAGRSKSLTLGVYPEVGIKEARAKCAAARKDVEAGIDPTQKRKTEKLLRAVNIEDTFEAVALEWHRARIQKWSVKYAAQVLRILRADVFPKLGSRRIHDITAPELLAVLREIENRGALVTAHTVKSYVSQVFRFGISIAKVKHDIAADLKGALKTPNRRHFAHLQENELPEFLQRLNDYDGGAQTKRALQLVTYTLVRTTDMRGARKTEIDFKKATWLIPAERMKMKEKHIVPLSTQALELFRQQIKASGNGEFVFPNRHHPQSCMSENTMLFAIYRMGYHGRATTHGMRHTGSTILNEYGFNGDHVERQLAHADRDKVRATYNYAQYMPQRSMMMQWWADFIDAKAEGKAAPRLPGGKTPSEAVPDENWDQQWKRMMTNAKISMDELKRAKDARNPELLRIVKQMVEEFLPPRKWDSN